MGIRFYCPNGHKLNVKDFQAGKKGICPHCQARVQIPTESTRRPSKKGKTGRNPANAAPANAARGQTDGGNAPNHPAAATLAQPAAATAPDPAPAESPDPAAAEAPDLNPTTGPPSASPPAAPSAVPPPAAPPSPSVRPSPAADDLLLDGGDVVWYVRPSSGGQFGPASSDVMRAWIEEGRVSVDSLVWREGWRDWQEASEVFPQLGSGEAETPLAGIAAGAISPAVADRRLVRSRRRPKTSQNVVIILLVIAVIALACVLVWVLQRETGSGANQSSAAAAARSVAPSLNQLRRASGPGGRSPTCARS